jgi:hypothetical protein
MMGRRELRLRRVVAILLAAAGIAACSGSDSAADSTAVPTSSTTTSSSTTTTSTTEAPAETSTTEPPPTVAIETPTSTEPVAPGDAEAEIRATLARSFDDYSACLVSMPNCDPTVLEATRTGELLAGNVARIEEWNAAGYTVIDRDLYRYVIESVEVDVAGDRATAIVCLADGSKLVQPGAGQDGSDLIVDDTFVSGRDAWRMELGDDGQWRAFAAPAIGEAGESDICPAA